MVSAVLNIAWEITHQIRNRIWRLTNHPPYRIWFLVRRYHTNMIHSDGRAAGCLIEPASQEAMGSEITQHLLEYGARPLSLLEYKTAAQSLRERFDIRRTAKSYLEFSHSLEPSES